MPRLWLVAVLVAAGAASLIGASRVRGEDGAAPQDAPQFESVSVRGAEQTGLSLPTSESDDHLPTAGRDEAQEVAQLEQSTAPGRESRPSESEGQDYDPWEPFNDQMFSFNHDVLDRFVLKPAATAWDRPFPDAAP